MIRKYMSLLRTVRGQAQLWLACLLLGLACELSALAHGGKSFHPLSCPAFTLSIHRPFDLIQQIHNDLQVPPHHNASTKRSKHVSMCPNRTDTINALTPADVTGWYAAGLIGLNQGLAKAREEVVSIMNTVRYNH
jgi:hypothetical protein